MWDLRGDVRLYEQVQDWLPGREAAGEFLAMAVLYRLMQGDLPRVAGLALLIVLLMTWADMRSFPRAVGAVLALVAGLCWAGSGLAIFRINLSMVNFVGIPILMGIGVDVIIHLLHRLYEEGPGRIRRAMETTGWAAGLSTATTVLSFASLSFASNQGVRSLGLLILLGLTLVTLAAFVIVPLGWMTTWKVKGELPDDVDEIYDTDERERQA
jgi:predicted RND superfamily exporter protein